MDASTSDSLSALSALDDPVRRRLYELVCAQPEPVGREQAASAAGIGRPLAAYHLDRLAEAGLLTVVFRRPEGRGGPGAGRPAKLYARADREFQATAPPRDYGLAARLLAEAAAGDTTGATARALTDAAGRLGRELADAADETHQAPEHAPALADALRDRGYEPYDDDGVLRLRNCPFHAAARAHPELVCGMNLALIGGLLEGRGDDASAALEPAPRRCCVAVRGALRTPTSP